MIPKSIAGMFIFVMSSLLAHADMRYEIIDLSKRAVRLTYEVRDTKVGNRVFIFPSGGFIHDATRGKFHVESVFDLSTKQELEYEVIHNIDTGAPQVKAIYPRSLRSGETKTLQIAVQVNMPESALSRDKNGRYVFQYETSHAFEFLIPSPYYLVYTNHPVWFFEKGNQLVVQQMDKKERKLVFKIRHADSLSSSPK